MITTTSSSTSNTYSPYVTTTSYYQIGSDSCVDGVRLGDLVADYKRRIKNKKEIDKNMSNEIKRAYMSEMKTAYLKYKEALKDELDQQIKFNDNDGTLYREKIDRSKLTSEYWIKEYARLYSEFSSLGFITRISMEDDENTEENAKKETKSKAKSS